MLDLLRSETLKLTTIRTSWVLLAAVVALASAGTLLVHLTGGPFAADLLRDDGAQLSLLSIAPSGVFALVLGVLISTGDHRHGTITPTLLATPRRTRVLAAKVVVTVAAALVVALTTMATLAVVGAGAVLLRGGEIAVTAGDVAGLWGPGIVILLGSALLGLGVGEAVRSQVGAMVGVLVGVLVAAPLVGALVPSVSWYLPSGLDSVLLNSPADAPFGAPIAVLLYAAYAAAALGAGAAVLTRRDIA